MNVAKSIKVALLVLVVLLIFMAGVLVGNVYNVTDILCPAKAEPMVLEQDFVSKDGIVFPEGTVVLLRQCAYMKRFSYRFAIDNATQLKRHTDRVDGDHGFAELYPKGE